MKRVFLVWDTSSAEGRDLVAVFSSRKAAQAYVKLGSKWRDCSVEEAVMDEHKNAQRIWGAFISREASLTEFLAVMSPWHRVSDLAHPSFTHAHTGEYYLDIIVEARTRREAIKKIEKLRKEYIKKGVWPEATAPKRGVDAGMLGAAFLPAITETLDRASAARSLIK